MRTYTVQPGDTPARIAAEHAGCPKCARDLVLANRHKAAVQYPNGFLTFETLAAGEQIALPEKWFTQEFDALPKRYFAALPHPDGVSPSTLGDRAAGVLGDFASLDEASARVAALASASDDKFVADVDGAAAAIVRAVHDAGGSPEADRFAETARAAAGRATDQKIELVDAISAGTSGFDARNAILHSLSDGLVAARQALNTTGSGGAHASTAPSAQGGAYPQTRALVGINPCAAENVVRVCAAQMELGRSPDGKYGANTAADAQHAVPGAPGACAPRPAWWRAAGESNCPGVRPAPPPAPPSDGAMPLASTAKKGLSAAGIVGLGLLGVGTVGGAIYLATRERRGAKRGAKRGKERRG